MNENNATPPPWISVEDRYPEVGQDVVYFFHVCGTFVGKYVGEHCFGGEAGFLTDDVTHWMPYKKPNRPLLAEKPPSGEWTRIEEYVAELERDPENAARLREARIRLAPLLYPQGGPHYERMARGESPKQ
jgi:hypothetical protein